MNTDDYLAQCTLLLKDDHTYRLAQSYPHSEIKDLLESTITPFKEWLKSMHPQLYNYLLSQTRKHQTPKLYGIPKIAQTFQSPPTHATHCSTI